MAIPSQSQTFEGAAPYVPSTEIQLKGVKRTSEEHAEIYQRNQFPYVVKIDAKPGQITFVGSLHTYDPADPHLLEIARLWKEAKPDVALVESRVTPYSGRPEEAAKRGEPYFVLVMARQAGVEVFTLEPDAKTEGAALVGAESPERAMLFLTLRGYFSRRRTEANIPDGMVQFMMARRAKEYGIESQLKSVADLDAMWKRDFPDQIDWRKIDENVAWPGEEKTYLNKLSNVGNDVRDDHWAKTMVDLVRKGKKVFAVGGASHAIHLEPVLRATLSGKQ